MNDDVTVVLQVQVGGQTTLAEDFKLTQRFGQFYSADEYLVSYPVTCDSHGFDVFRDEFEDVPDRYVDFAALIVLPYPPDQFTPFTEESAGTELGQWTLESGWTFAE